MIGINQQDSPERQFLRDMRVQYIVQLMKHRDYSSTVVWRFPTKNGAIASRRRARGEKTPFTWTPHYAQRRRIQLPSLPISAYETQRRIYGDGNTTTDFWWRMKKINGKDFQLFWCIEDNETDGYRRVDAHGALFIAGLHTDRLNAKYSTNQVLREHFGEDYGVRDTIAECIRKAGLSVEHTIAHSGQQRHKYSTQIFSVRDLKMKSVHGSRSVDELKTFYLTKSINDASGSMCFGFNRKQEKNFIKYLHAKSHEQFIGINKT